MKHESDLVERFQNSNHMASFPGPSVARETVHPNSNHCHSHYLQLCSAAPASDDARRSRSAGGSISRRSSLPPSRDSRKRNFLAGAREPTKEVNERGTATSVSPFFYH